MITLLSSLVIGVLLFLCYAFGAVSLYGIRVYFALQQTDIDMNYVLNCPYFDDIANMVLDGLEEGRSVEYTTRLIHTKVTNNKDNHA